MWFPMQKSLFSILWQLQGGEKNAKTPSSAPNHLYPAPTFCLEWEVGVNVSTG